MKGLGDVLPQEQFQKCFQEAYVSGSINLRGFDLSIIN